MKITNFENFNMLKAILSFFVVYGLKESRILLDYKLKGKTSITATNYEKKIAQKPNIRSIFKAIGWIIKNWKYLQKKHQMVNSNRIFSTSQLTKIKVIHSTKN